jgi:hypothetical protein
MASEDNPAMVHYLSSSGRTPEFQVQKSRIYIGHTEYFSIIVATRTIRRPMKMRGEALIEMKSIA